MINILKALMWTTIIFGSVSGITFMFTYGLIFAPITTFVMFCVLWFVFVWVCVWAGLYS